MATKFGHLFQKEFRHYVLFRRKIKRELIKALRLLSIPQDRSLLDTQVLSLASLMLELGDVVTDCFKKGFLSSGFHQLRLAQECGMKLMAFLQKPSLVRKKKVPPKDVREVLEQHGFPPWGKYYGELSKISHLDRDFVLIMYPAMWARSPVRKGVVVLMDYYLMWLNVFSAMALYAVLNQLKPRMGRDFEELWTSYVRLHKRMDADYKSATAKIKKAETDDSLGLLL